MLPRVTVEISTRTMLTLLQHLSNRQFGAHPSTAVEEAINMWIAAADEKAPQQAPVHGYQWKRLFLPAGTRLRITTQLLTYHAEVVGDEILYNGESVSPNQFVAFCAGAPRNAWQTISLLMPGEPLWRPADCFRRELARQAQLKDKSDGDTRAALIAHPMGNRERRRDERRVDSRTLYDQKEGASAED